MKGIKTTELYDCKANIMANPTFSEDVAGTVELYLTFIKKMKAENPQINVSEVNYSDNRQGGDNNHHGKRGSSGISSSNSSSTDAVVDDRFL
jgi:hypothetical protein